MTKMYTTRRRLLMGGAMLGAAGLGQALYPRRRVAPITDSQFERYFPKQVGDWQYIAASGLVLPPQDQLSKALYEQLITRVYADPTDPDVDPVMMLVAYSSTQEGKLHVHRPDVCYPASGFAISGLRRVDVPIGRGTVLPCQFMVAERGTRHENVLFWTRVGDDMPLVWSHQRLVMAIDNLKGFVPDGVLGRVSVVSPDEEGAIKTMASFLQSLFGSISQPARTLLIGAR